MPRTPATRKYQLTLNNPAEHGWSHDYIKNVLSTFSSLLYWCMCDEVGDNKTPHTHVFIIFQNPVQFKVIQKAFYGVHIETTKGSNQENRDYVRKEGKWADSEKKETNLPETFEEYGELPQDRASGKKETEAIYEMIKQGADNMEILEAYPNAMNKLDKIDAARQTILAHEHKKKFRELDVTYIYGQTGVGKTRSVMEKYGYENVYRVTNYEHPFDQYQGEDVVLLDEFRGRLTISEMLNYLDGYPVSLSCRYRDKQACYTKVYIISNISLDEQYPNIQAEQPRTWEALKRRINHVYEMLPSPASGNWLDE